MSSIISSSTFSVHKQITHWRLGNFWSRRDSEWKSFKTEPTKRSHKRGQLGTICMWGYLPKSTGRIKFGKVRAPASLGAISSKRCSKNLERFTALFSLLRSKQILSLPLLFCTGNKGAHHSVGSVTYSMIPASSIRLSPSSTFGIKGKAILHAVLMQ